MKIALVLGPYSIGSRPLDFWYSNILVSSRGLTGTELCLVKMAEEFAKKQHEVHLFTVHAQPHNKPEMWAGAKLYNFDELVNVVDDTFDCVISLNEPEVFSFLSNSTTKPLRIVWQMLNDFSYCGPNYDDFVDLYLGVCHQHMEILKARSIRPDKWDMVPLGCSPEVYEDRRVPGRVIWCSSADRGLHWLLSQWPKIRKEVPYASLKIFYHFNYGAIPNIEPHDKNNHFHIVEMGQRVRYIKNAIEKLKDFGVEHIGSVSRQQINEEFSQASVFGYTCDTVSFSEGFSVSTLEAHASYTVPVITDKDCLGSIYKDSGCIVIPSPIKDHLPEYTNSIIKSLTDKAYADDVIDRCRKFALEHSWEKSVSKLEQKIIEYKGKKNG